MSAKEFLDTNIFIYAIDSSPNGGHKREIARNVIRRNIENETGVISIQVLQEFFQVATHKIQIPLSTEEALEYLHYMSILETVHPDFHMLVSAIRIHQRFSVSFWDALIFQAAKTAGCLWLISEDLQDGFHVDDLKVKNPF
jgi:predicted nucleic acid-binding protein